MKWQSGLEKFNHLLPVESTGPTAPGLLEADAGSVDQNGADPAVFPSLPFSFHLELDSRDLEWDCPLDGCGHLVDQPSRTPVCHRIAPARIRCVGRTPRVLCSRHEPWVECATV